MDWKYCDAALEMVLSEMDDALQRVTVAGVIRDDIFRRIAVSELSLEAEKTEIYVLQFATGEL